jgi:hypothetical protein
MSSYQAGGIHVESEGIATSGRHSPMCRRKPNACPEPLELLDLTPRHIQRLKARYRQGSAAALARASRDRPSHRRLPERVRVGFLHLARTRYAGFTSPLRKATLRRLLRSQGTSELRLAHACGTRLRQSRPAPLPRALQPSLSVVRRAKSRKVNGRLSLDRTAVSRLAPFNLSSRLLSGRIRIFILTRRHACSSRARASDKLRCS